MRVDEQNKMSGFDAVIVHNPKNASRSLDSLKDDKDLAERLENLLGYLFFRNHWLPRPAT
jgi:hypothetical protein